MPVGSLSTNGPPTSRGMRELTAVKTAPGAAVADVLAADLAIAHLDADLRWMQTATDRVADLRLEVHR